MRSVHLLSVLLLHSGEVAALKVCDPVVTMTGDASRYRVWQPDSDESVYENAMGKITCLFGTHVGAEEIFMIACID